MGRKAILTAGTPHFPQNNELGRNSWAMVEEWLAEGDIQVCSAITVWIISQCISNSQTNMKSFQMGLKVSLEGLNG